MPSSKSSESKSKSGYKKLRRSDDKVIAGVAGGIAEYFNIDPVIVRIIFLALLFTGSGVVLYLISYFLMPAKSGDKNKLSKLIVFSIVVLVMLFSYMIYSQVMRYGAYGKYGMSGMMWDYEKYDCPMDRGWK